MLPSIHETLGDVLSYHDAIPLVNEFLASIPVDVDDPTFLFEWQEDNVAAFVAAANAVNPLPPVPRWLRTLPPNMTPVSFVDDLITHLEPLAGARCGHFMLAPNTVQQCGALVARLIAIQATPFVQQVARVALPVVNGVERLLARTHHQTDSGGVHLARPNTLPHPGEPPVQSSVANNNDPLRLFF